MTCLVRNKYVNLEHIINTTQITFLYHYDLFSEHKINGKVEKSNTVKLKGLSSY